MATFSKVRNMATFSKVRKRHRKLYKADFSKASFKTAKRYIKHFEIHIYINQNSSSNPYFRSLLSAYKRVYKKRGEFNGQN